MRLLKISRIEPQDRQSEYRSIDKMQSKSTSKKTKNISSELQEEKIGKLINFPFSFYKQYQVKPNVIL